MHYVHLAYKSLDDDDSRKLFPTASAFGPNTDYSKAMITAMCIMKESSLTATYANLCANVVRAPTHIDRACITSFCSSARRSGQTFFLLDTGSE